MGGGGKEGLGKLGLGAKSSLRACVVDGGLLLRVPH